MSLKPWMPANDKLVNPLNPWELRFLGVFFCLNVPSTQSQGYCIMTIRTKDEQKKISFSLSTNASVSASARVSVSW